MQKKLIAVNFDPHLVCEIIKMPKIFIEQKKYCEKYRTFLQINEIFLQMRKSLKSVDMRTLPPTLFVSLPLSRLHSPFSSPSLSFTLQLSLRLSHLTP